MALADSITSACSDSELPTLTLGDDMRSSGSYPKVTCDGLPELRLRRDARGPAMLELRRTIGEGGMGVVCEAMQLALDRQVAVKLVRPEDDSEQAAAALLREALVTGMLEHPNIVPVYAVGRSEDGNPVLVMKHIAGKAWREATVIPVTAETLEEQLGVLMQVCKAVHYAHGKGIVHRDLKLDNVMIGELGEVYVLDWGLAVSLRGEHAGRIPLAREVSSIAGTPQYMAPEMAAANGAAIDERTDVYLLGAMLHELLTSHARHDSLSLQESLHRALASAPYEFPPDVPPELGEICNRATSRFMHDRFASAEELRQALAAFLERRCSRELAAEADKRLAALEALLASERMAGRADERATHALAIEARFGFRQALRVWPDNPSAKRGLQRVLEHGIEQELRQGRSAAAAALLAELPAPRADLQVQLSLLDARRREDEGSARELAALRRELDLQVEAPGRRRFLLWVSGAVVVMAVSLGVAIEAGAIGGGYPAVLGAAAVTLLLALIGRVRVGPRLNRINLRLVDAAVIAAAASLVHLAIARALGVAHDAALGTMLLQIAAIVAAAATPVHRAAWLSVGAFGACGAATLLLPRWDYGFVALAFVLGTLALSLALRPQAQR